MIKVEDLLTHTGKSELSLFIAEMLVWLQKEPEEVVTSLVADLIRVSGFKDEPDRYFEVYGVGSFFKDRDNWSDNTDIDIMVIRGFEPDFEETLLALTVKYLMLSGLHFHLLTFSALEGIVLKSGKRLEGRLVDEFMQRLN